MPSNLPPGDSAPPPSTSRKPPSALLANASATPLSNIWLRTCSNRPPPGAALSILSLRPTRSRFFQPPFASVRSKILLGSFARADSCSSSPEAADRPTPKDRCLGRSHAPNFPLSPPLAWKNSPSRIFSPSKIRVNHLSVASAFSTASHFESFSSRHIVQASLDGIPAIPSGFFSPIVCRGQRNVILRQPVACHTKFIKRRRRPCFKSS